jgi:hypothetical protein
MPNLPGGSRPFAKVAGAAIGLGVMLPLFAPAWGLQIGLAVVVLGFYYLGHPG